MGFRYAFAAENRGDEGCGEAVAGAYGVGYLNLGVGWNDTLPGVKT